MLPGFPDHLIQFPALFIRKLRKLELPHLRPIGSFQLVFAGRHRKKIILRESRFPAMFRDEFLFFGLNLTAAFRVEFHHLCRNAFQVEPDDPAFLVAVVNRFVTEFPAFPGQMVVVDLPGVADRPAHFQCLQRLIIAVGVLRQIDHHVMRMELRIERTAGVVREPRIKEFAGKLIVPGFHIFARPHPDRGQIFQFVHRRLNRLLMGLKQPGIEQ